MSERRSWDIPPKKASGSRSGAGTPAPQRTTSPRPTTRAAARPSTRQGAVDMVRSAPARPTRVQSAPAQPRVTEPRTASRPAPRAQVPHTSPTVRSTPRRASSAPKGRLRERRDKARKTALITVSVILLILLSVVVFATWLPQLRIQTVEASGPRADSLETLAQEKLSGSYAFIVPRNSIFFFPEQDIQQTALEQYPEIAELSVSRTGFSALEIVATPRAKAFIWCGTSIDAALPSGQCYEADAGGLLYGFAGAPSGEVAVDEATAPTVTTTIGGAAATEDLRVYAPLTVELNAGESPLGARVSHTQLIPDALRFVTAIEELNVPIESLSLRNDEADLWVNDSTRITYVLGREQSAAQLAVSVIPTLNLTDGTIQYLDLRFSGKAYLKRYGE